MSNFERSMQQRVRADGDIFENTPRVDADIFKRIRKGAFSKISGYVWTWPESNERCIN